jgi:hypothetical protein
VLLPWKCGITVSCQLGLRCCRNQLYSWAVPIKHAGCIADILHVACVLCSGIALVMLQNCKVP